MNQTGNRNSIFGWVKNLKRNTMSNDSVNEIHDDLSISESRSPSRTSFQSGRIPFPASPTKERAIPQPSSQHNNSHHGSATGAASEFLRPLLSHKSRSTNNVNNSRSDSLSLSMSNQDSSSGLRQRRDSFLQSNPLVDENSKYFGVPLADAIEQAAAKISILGSESANTSDDDVLHYGRIPIVVAKCGVYLKKNGLNVEGIFRVGGSSKRIKELQIIFNTPPDFGKKLNWDGFNVHDAASVLRRYLNALPEPLIPLDLYEEFRDPLKSRPRIIKYLKYKADNATQIARKATVLVPSQADAISAPQKELLSTMQASQDQINAEDSGTTSEKTSVATHAADSSPSPSKSQPAKRPRSYKSLTRDVYGAIDDYKQLLDDLPCLSKQLLFYILDLLAMVQSYSGENLMPSRNLAAIFQPSILSHPDHDMLPEEYDVSQSVVEFLIQYSYKLLPNSDSKQEASSSDSIGSGRQAENASLKRAPSGRQHSKSLSTPNQDLDFIGFRSSSKPSRSLTLSDTEHDFISASSEDDEDFDKQVQSSWQALTLSAATERDSSRGSPKHQTSDAAIKHTLPQVVLEKPE